MTKLPSILKLKCPNCSKGNVYQKHHFFSYAKMNEYCSVCKYSFDKEPGFFYGAMYVSYGLTVTECLTTFVACGVLFFDNWFSYYLLPIMIAVLLVLSPTNYRLSRVVWIYIFTKKTKLKN